jgi:hypothetical protein
MAEQLDVKQRRNDYHSLGSTVGVILARLEQRGENTDSYIDAQSELLVDSARDEVRSFLSGLLRSYRTAILERNVPLRADEPSS